VMAARGKARVARSSVTATPLATMDAFSPHVRASLADEAAQAEVWISGLWEKDLFRSTIKVVLSVSVQFFFKISYEIFIEGQLELMLFKGRFGEQIFVAYDFG
jgi:hypothetical protein